MSISYEAFDLLKLDRDAERRARATRVARTALWAGLLAFGLRRRGVLGLAATALSLERLYRMFAPPVCEGVRTFRSRDSRRSQTGGRFDRDWDRIDEALWETFPASDPPGHLTR